jgi:hypothetical protein
MRSEGGREVARGGVKIRPGGGAKHLERFQGVNAIQRKVLNTTERSNTGIILHKC